MAAKVYACLSCIPQIIKTRLFSEYIPACTFTRQCRSLASAGSKSSTLQDHLVNRIKASGPLTVAAFMQEVLTNPLSGYYMNKDVFGQAGDFTTSPEISQVFGELVGVWFVNQWMTSGKKKLQLVELGPGRGTLASDVLQVFGKFAELLNNISLHLVEVSPTLSGIQESTLTGGSHNDTKNEKQSGATRSTAFENEVGSDLCYKRCITQGGVPVSWYRAIQDAPLEENTFFLAHEFFDALPVHQFQKTDQGWREVLVDVTQEQGSFKLRFVLAPGPTVASQALVPKGTLCTQIEVCPQAGAIIESMSEVIAKHGGCALIVDYGEEESARHTLRGFKNHKLHEVLEDPGTADVTANVDFSYLRNATRGKVQTFGPVTQRSFLQQMGIDMRMKILLEKADSSQAQALQSGYKMLTSPSEMGDKFKMFSLVQNGLPRPAAFR
ncbi:protein arginine methyltransferase NDUFAF7, mitochondrial-like isoform X1 [Acropora palmata]|uniref:protein arginine methyltransferase NDUFAF7, mitochondrial-like isoform X1 n=1 Tax=Acropora palmata TaxID=6131 RepID=UPI003D9FC458